MWLAGQNCAASAEAERSSVSGGRTGLDVEVVSRPLICRVPWKELKKKSLSRRMGPPSVAPYWFCLRFGFGWPVELRKNVLALKMSFRTNSQASPWKSFSPLLVISAVVGTCAP